MVMNDELISSAYVVKVLLVAKKYLHAVIYIHLIFGT